MQIDTRLNGKSGSVRAVVTRANGRIEDYGLIAYWHRNPVINWAVNSYISLKRKIYK